MTNVKVHEDVKAFLATLTEEAVLRDADGTLLGLFKPPARAEAELHERAKALFDLEEAERVAATEHHGYTIEEVMRYLYSLEPTG